MITDVPVGLLPRPPGACHGLCRLLAARQRLHGVASSQQFGIVARPM
ncbi:hypothetical protein AB0I69_09445 [Streptomyces sp. NPDC050508]